MQASGDYNYIDLDADTTGGILETFIDGLGMVTSTWKETAAMKTQAAMYGAEAQRKRNPIMVIGIAAGVVAALTIGAILIIRSSK